MFGQYVAEAHCGADPILEKLALVAVPWFGL